MHSIPIDDKQQKNSKDNKTEQLRRSIYKDTHVYVLRSVALKKKFGLVSRYNLSQKTRQYQILEYMITSIRSLPNGFGKDKLVDLTEAKFIKNPALSEILDCPAKTVRNIKSLMVDSKLIVVSGCGQFALHPNVIEFLTGTTIKVPEKEVSRPPGHSTVPTPGTPMLGTVPTPGTHNNECSNKKVIITDIHSGVLSVEKISIRWALIANRSRERNFVYMPNETKLKTFLQELKSLNRESEEKRKANRVPVIDGKIENAGRVSPPAPDYPPRDFKLGQSAKYCTGANGLKNLVFDIVKGKLWVSLKEGELDELSDRIYQLERSHGDLFFEYLKIASDYSDKSKKEGGNRTTLRDALFDDTNIKLVTEALWKKRQTKK